MLHLIRFTMLALLVSSTGCTSLNWNKMPKMPWAKKEVKEIESGYQQPTRMVVLWSPDVITGPGKPSTRGFGGRIYFYNNAGKAIPVEGQLVVYGYDDTNRQQVKKEPDRRFVFTPQQFTQHFSETDLGASYSVWVPWGRLGEPQKSVTLLPVFTSTSGYKVVGQQTMNVLPGKGADTNGVPSSGHVPLQRQILQADVAPVGHIQPASAQQQQPRRAPTTINVTPSMSRRLHQAAATATPQKAPALHEQFRKLELATATMQANRQAQQVSYEQPVDPRAPRNGSARTRNNSARFTESKRWKDSGATRFHPIQPSARFSPSTLPVPTPPSAPSSASLAPYPQYPAISTYAPPQP